MLGGRWDHRSSNFLLDFLLRQENPTMALGILLGNKSNEAVAKKNKALSGTAPGPSTTSHSTMWFKLRAHKLRYQGQESPESLTMKYRRSLFYFILFFIFFGRVG
ncbi:hypothetical protein K449DRAFT_24617 [Hypoxylon sp. EC38]|nr:hypothetical protein K449DRAFT_24617 [Hypoxylon sp. EC38]